MRQPGADAREFRAGGGGTGIWGARPGGGPAGAGSDGGRTGAAGRGGGQAGAGGPDGVPPPRLAGEPAPPAPPCAPGGPRHDQGRQAAAGDRAGERPRLPPGQYVQAALPVLHYGPVPAFNPLTWDLRIYGATADGRERRWSWDAFLALPRAEIVADFHCVTKFSVLGITWLGVPVAEVVRAAPPGPAATHVMIWAEFGYGANLPLDALAEEQTLLATHRDGKELTPEQGHPVRLVVPSRYGWKNVKWVRAFEYLAADRRGFWEERGYHNNADPWREQRYSYQEMPGEGPEL